MLEWRGVAFVRPARARRVRGAGPKEGQMRSTLLAGAAVCALFVALPSASTYEPADPGAARFDPLLYLSSLCRTPGGQPPLITRFLSAAAAYAATTEGAADAPPPLILGAASGVMEATVNDAARPWFEQGMGLVDGFNHAEGVRAFRAAQALDPDCAMCFWGEAYALGPNINKVMDPADNPRAIEAAKLALEKSAGAAEVERALTPDGARTASRVLGIRESAEPLAPCWRCVRAGRGAMSCAPGNCRCDYQQPTSGCAA